LHYAIILPVFNEAATLPQVLEAVLTHPGVQVVLVDDGSTDSTPTITRRYPLHKVITHSRNEGYGRSLMDGFEYVVSAGYDACITMDTDAQHEPDRIPCFLEKLKDTDIVSGSRYLDPELMRHGVPPPERLEINGIITAKINALTGFRLTDSFCGFKAYRTEALKRLTLTEDSYGLPIQVWMQAAKAGLRVTECAVPLIYRDHSRNFNDRFADRAERLDYYLHILERESAGL
jgi:glycosyltransferase involved in cell wall biosynthesis